MIEITLTQGMVALIDDDRERFICHHKWYAHKHGRTFYARRNVRLQNGSYSSIKMHHVIFGKPHEGLEWHHLDGNGLNNQKENIIQVTHRQNCQHRHIDKASKYPGITWYKRLGLWRSDIQINGKSIHLGYYECELDAFAAYSNAIESIGERILICQ